MMHYGKEKDGLMLAIGVGKKPSKHEEKNEDESSDKDESMQAEFAEFADAAFEAVKNGDKEAFQEALKGAIEACMEY